MKLRWKLAEILQKQRMSQRELARMTGISFPTINALCNNKSTQWREETIVILMSHLKLRRLEQLIEVLPDAEGAVAQ